MSDKQLNIDAHILMQTFDEKLFKSHSEISKTVSNFGADLKRGLVLIDKQSNKLDSTIEHQTKIDITLALMRQSQKRQEESIESILTLFKEYGKRTSKLELWRSATVASTGIVVGIGSYLAIKFFDLQNTVSAHIGTVIK